MTLRYIKNEKDMQETVDKLIQDAAQREDRRQLKGWLIFSTLQIVNPIFWLWLIIPGLMFHTTQARHIASTTGAVCYLLAVIATGSELLARSRAWKKGYKYR